MSQSELLNTQMNAEDPNKENSGKLIEREQIPGSPFWIIGDEEKGYFLAFNKWQLTEYMRTKQDIKENLETNKWDIILKLILCLPDTKNLTAYQ